MAGNDTSLDLRHYLQVVWRRRWACAAAVVATFTSAVIFTWTQTPIFQAEATLLIEPEAPKLMSNVQDVVPTTLTEDYYPTQYKLIQSRPVIERAIERHGLRKRMPWLDSMEDPYWGVAGSVGVDPIKNTRLVQVKFYSADPKLAADGANAVAAAYVGYTLDTKHKVAQESLIWLNEQLTSLRTQAQQSSKALQSYQARADLLGLKEQSQLAQARLADANRAYAEAQNQRVAIEVRLRELARLAQDPKAAEAIHAAVFEDPVIRKLKNDFADLLTERAKIAQIYREKHPDLKTLDAQIKQVDLRLQAEIHKVHRAVETELKIARAREESLLARVSDARREARTVTEREAQALGLQLEKDSSEELHGVVLKRLKETGVATMLEASNVRIVELATTPVFPARPRTRLIWTMSVVGGLALGIGLAFLSESLDNRVRSRVDLERLGLPVLGIIPAFDVKRRSARP